MLLEKQRAHYTFRFPKKKTVIEVIKNELEGYSISVEVSTMSEKVKNTLCLLLV